MNTKTGFSVAIPRSQDDLQEALQELGNQLNKVSNVAVVQIDQFESILALPQVFEAALDLVATCTTRSLPIVWVLTRKNDITVT